MQFWESAGQGYFSRLVVGQASRIMSDVDVSGKPRLGSEKTALDCKAGSWFGASRVGQFGWTSCVLAMSSKLKLI